MADSPFRKPCPLYKGSAGPKVVNKPFIKCGYSGLLTYDTPEAFLERFRYCFTGNHEDDQCPIYKIEKALKEVNTL